jgi:hypothetical protein
VVPDDHVTSDAGDLLAGASEESARRVTELQRLIAIVKREKELLEEAASAYRAVYGDDLEQYPKSIRLYVERAHLNRGRSKRRHEDDGQEPGRSQRSANAPHSSDASPASRSSGQNDVHNVEMPEDSGEDTAELERDL